MIEQCEACGTGGVVDYLAGHVCPMYASHHTTDLACWPGNDFGAAGRAGPFGNGAMSMALRTCGPQIRAACGHARAAASRRSRRSRGRASRRVS